MFCSLNIPYLLFGSSMGRHWCWRWKLFVDVIGWCHLSTHGSDRGHWSAHCFYNIHQAEVISTHMSLLHVMCLLYQLWKVDDVCSMQHESPSSCYPSHYNVWNLISKKNLPCFPLLCTIECKNQKMCVSGGRRSANSTWLWNVIPTVVLYLYDYGVTSLQPILTSRQFCVSGCEVVEVMMMTGLISSLIFPRNLSKGATHVVPDWRLLLFVQY